MKSPGRHIARVAFPALALAALAACGGGGDSAPAPVGGTDTGGTGSIPPPPPPFVGYVVGGKVSGLVGQGLVLRLYGLNYTRPQILDEVAISSDGNFHFKETIGANGPNATVAGEVYPNLFYYAVSIAGQPTLPAQRCVVNFRYTNFAIASDVADVAIVCGEFWYATNSADNTISAFSVDAHVGALGAVGPPVVAGRSPSAIATTDDRKYVYVINSGSNDVSAFSVDPDSGMLTRVRGSPFAAGPEPRALAIADSLLYVANAGSDILSVYQVDRVTGVLTPLSPASYPTATGPSAMAMDPGGYGYDPLLYTANTGGSKDISVFTVDRSTGDLTPIEGSPSASGGNITSFAEAGEFRYAADASGDTAAIYGYSLVTPAGLHVQGAVALTSIPGFPLALPGCNFVIADHTGAYLYATAGARVFGYRIDPLTGALSALPGFPLALSASADFAGIDSANRFLYVTSRSAGIVTGFTLDAATGELVSMPGSPFAVTQ
jgi:6-phosphogluconolactonase